MTQTLSSQSHGGARFTDRGHGGAVRLRFALLLLALLMVTMAACGESDDGGAVATHTPAYRESGLEEVYGRMSAALRREGEVYRGTVTSVLLQEPFMVTTTSEITAAFAAEGLGTRDQGLGETGDDDAADGDGTASGDDAEEYDYGDVNVGGGSSHGDRARVEVRSEFGADMVREATWIIDGERWYQTTPEGGVRKREALRCRGSQDVVLSLLLGCRGAEEESITTPIGEVTYEGRQALAIVTVGNVRGVEEESTFTETLYVDVETWLPLGLEGSGKLASTRLSTDGPRSVIGDDGSTGGAVAGGSATAVGRIVRYAHAFGPAGFVDDDVFDPAGIGYAESDPAWPLLREEPDFTYYWLGREVDGDDGEGRPELALAGAYVADQAVRPALRWRELLQYRSAADEFGEILVEVVGWRADEKREVGGEKWDAPPAGCVVVDEYEVSLGRVTVYGPADVIAGDDVTAGATEVASATAGPGEACARWGALVVGETVVLEVTSRGASGWGSAEGMGVLVSAVVGVR